MLLAEHAEHLVLLPHGAQLRGVGGVGQAQQQAVAVGHHVEQEELAGAHQQRAVEVVGRAVERVVGGVERAQAFEQQRLALEPLAAEARRGLLGGAGDAVEGQVGGHNLVHAASDGVDVGGRHAAGQHGVAVVTVRHGRVDAQQGAGVKVAHSLVEHEEERAGVSAKARGATGVDKLHVLGAEQRVVQALHLVVDLGAGGAVGHVQMEGGIHLLKRGAEGHGVRLPRVVATYANRVFHKIQNLTKRID